MGARVRRWEAWARLLKERHGRVARRQTSLSMVLLRFRNGVAIRHAWRPQVWVTVRAGAKLQVNASQVPGPAAREIPPGRQVAVRTSAAAVFGRRELVGARPGAPAAVPVVQAVRREVLLQTRTAAPRGSAAPGMTAASKAYTAVPLDTVRTGGKSTVVTESIARQIIHKAQRLEELMVRTVRKETEHRLEHVVRRNSRREEMRPMVPMVLRPAAAAVPSDRPQGSEEWAVRERETVREFAPAPAININSLTEQVMDQIDRRVVAWRERMGKF